ncbi:sigma-70 family RNA polymerase sigma factor [Sphingorhabdus buctiana]|uniref:Sigma-70 family RNA polymerase sigma factor n=2 Tax=Sphingorhabdus buctiana TaxID=1508805 RepID=A0ABW4MF97_9SPHN
MIANEEGLRRLMRLSQGGDKQAYAILLEQCGAWLARYYRQKIAPDAIDDLVQETLMSLHRKRASYDPSRPFLPWLAAIARYRWVDRLRQAYRNEADSIGNHDPSEDSHEEVVAAKISIDRLLDLIPTSQSDAIRCMKIEGLSIAETCQRTGQSEALVKVNIHRGLKRLSALVESE